VAAVLDARRDVIPTVFRRGVSDATVAFARAGVRFAERFTVALRRKFKTAAWAYLPPHRIWLGDGMLERARKRLPMSEKEAYASAYVRHEYSHMRWTTTRMKELAEQMAREEIPHSLWNLFEDARIEHLCREALQLRFDWLRFEEADAPTTPSGLMFALIQHEGELAEPQLPPRREAQPHERVWGVFAEVVEFYREIISCPTTEELLPIMRRWLERFPCEKHDRAEHGEGTGGRGRGTPGTGEGNADADATMGMLDPEALVQWVDTLDERSDDITAQISGRGEGKESVSFESVGNADLLLPTARCRFADDARAHHVADALAKILVRPAGWVSREAPSKVVDIRSAISSSTSGWRFRVRELPRPKRYKLALLFDCSGSMNGTPLSEGKILVAALSYLAQRGALSGYLALSAISGRRSMWQRLAFPVPVDVIERLQAFGDAEGLQQALLANAMPFGEADQVLVYTDADICDTPLDRGELARKRIRPIGLYVGDAEHATEMPRHFAEYLVRPNIEALAEAMVARFKVRGR